MKMKFLPFLPASFLLVFCLCGFGQLMADESPSRYQLAQIAADEAYDNGEYEKAFKKYLNLARKGDTFSQYRLSYMYFQGQSVGVDWAEAFGWAVLASQGNNSTLVKYMAALARQVPEDQAKEATLKARHYLDRWGDMAIAEDARRGAIRELRGCTGSRLGTRCEEVYAMQMPKFWDNGNSHSPFIGDSSTKGSTSYATGNGAGGPVQNLRYYQNLRFGLLDLERYIGLNGGNVEIGELETLDDEMSSSVEN